MATYITLASWTDQGIKSYGNTIDRAEAAGQLAVKVGVTIKQIYWTLGAYDFVSILEAADDESATAFNLAISSLGKRANDDHASVRRCGDARDRRQGGRLTHGLDERSATPAG